MNVIDAATALAMIASAAIGAGHSPASTTTGPNGETADARHRASR